MTVAKRVRRRRNEIARVYWGINPSTLAVECVTATAERMLTLYRVDGTAITHQMTKRLRPRSEVISFWGLLDVIEVRPQLEDGSAFQIKLASLRKKAAEMRRSAE